MANGEIFGVIGAHGAGKTTLCRMVAGLIPFEGGEILAGTPEVRIDGEGAAGLVGYVPAEFGGVSGILWRTVWNIRIPDRPANAGIASGVQNGRDGGGAGGGTGTTRKETTGLSEMHAERTGCTCFG